MMTDVNDISDEVLIKSIKEILDSADLNVWTSKLVRNELKTKLKAENLDSRKKQINSLINDVIIDLHRKQNKKNKVKDIPKDTNCHIKTEVTEDKPKPIESQTNSRVKEEKESEDNSSSSDGKSEDEKELTDEGLARKLQNEELDSKRRVTRNNRSAPKRSSTKKSNKRKNKDNSDDSGEEKPKKRKQGYLKPCLLSEDLAHFLGESEMPRHEVVKRIWSYVREKNLLDPKNKQFAICDNPLIKIFGKKRVRMFGMMKFLAKHLK